MALVSNQLEYSYRQKPCIKYTLVVSMWILCKTFDGSFNLEIIVFVRVHVSVRVQTMLQLLLAVTSQAVDTYTIYK